MSIVIKAADLAPQEAEAWRLTKSGLQWQAPAFMYILIKMCNPDDNESILRFTRNDPRCGTMYTDGKLIGADIDFFMKMSVPNRVAGCVHEIAHAMFGHCQQLYEHVTQKKGVTWNGVTLPFEMDLSNQAMDYVINAMIAEAGIGKLGANWLYDPKRFNSDMTWQEAYHILHKTQGGKGGGGAKPQDVHFLPGEISGVGQKPGEGEGTSGGNSPPPPYDEMKWKRVIAGALATAQAVGQCPENLKRLFEKILEPKVSWVDKVKGMMARRLGAGGYNFRQPDRRLITRDIYVPSRSGHGAKCVVVARDGSGSIYSVPHLIDRWQAELKGVLTDVRPRRIVAIWCDAQINMVKEIEDDADFADDYRQGAQGGGGTSFAPVFEYLEKHGIVPDALIYLTDLEGQFPDKAPEYPVIWGTIKDHPVPFGEKVLIPNDGSA